MVRQLSALAGVECVEKDGRCAGRRLRLIHELRPVGRPIEVAGDERQRDFAGAVCIGQVDGPWIALLDEDDLLPVRRPSAGQQSIDVHVGAVLIGPVGVHRPRFDASVRHEPREVDLSAIGPGRRLVIVATVGEKRGSGVGLRRRSRFAPRVARGRRTSGPATTEPISTTGRDGVSWWAARTTVHRARPARRSQPPRLRSLEPRCRRFRLAAPSRAPQTDSRLWESSRYRRARRRRHQAPCGASRRFARGSPPRQSHPARPA